MTVKRFSTETVTPLSPLNTPPGNPRNTCDPPTENCCEPGRWLGVNCQLALVIIVLDFDTECTTNHLERLFREFRTKSDEIGDFSNEASCLTMFCLVMERDHAKHDRGKPCEQFMTLTESQYA